MQHFPLLLAATLLCTSLQAQPTLTASTNAPTPGSSYMVNYGPYVQPGNPGAAQTWDLTALATDSTMQVMTVHPGTTPNGAQFPTATAAEVSEAVTQYFRTAADGIHFAGSDDGTTVIVHAPQGKYLALPCTFGTSWSTPQNATFAYDGTPVARTGTFSGHADGYGTLVMPGGTIPNVLRVHWTHTLQDVTSFFTISYSYDSYAFFVAGQPHPIAELVTASTDLGGGPVLNQFSRWSNDISTAVAAPQAPLLGVFPNPASDVVTITLPNGSGTPSTLTVADMAGRTVLHELLAGTHTTTVRLDVSSLFGGTYQVTITTADGRRHTATLIVR